MKLMRIYPPQWTLGLLAAEVALDRWLPVRYVIPDPVRWAGIPMIALGLGVILWAAALFKRNKTGIIPFSESTAVVTNGPYRFTRNPMYLGMTLMLLGTAIILRSLTPFVAPPLFVAIITWQYILPEEAHMERALGAPYLELKRKVRRWL